MKNSVLVLLYLTFICSCSLTKNRTEKLSKECKERIAQKVKDTLRVIWQNDYAITKWEITEIKKHKNKSYELVSKAKAKNLADFSIHAYFDSCLNFIDIGKGFIER